MKYLDVSEWQGEIDWETVKGHVDGAILRAGYGKGHADRQFARNVSECSRLGIPCGAYWFSYAWTPEMAAAEARCLLEAVKPYRMELPLAFDFEYDSVNYAALEAGVTVTKALATELVYAFCETVEGGGYWCLNYANPDFLARYYDETVPLRFGLWLAAWRSDPDLAAPPRDCAVWQWTSSGSVPGVPGRVDVNEAYTDFAALIRAGGLNRLGAASQTPPFAKGGWPEGPGGLESESIGDTNDVPPADSDPIPQSPDGDSLRPALPQCRSRACFAAARQRRGCGNCAPACICRWQRRGRNSLFQREPSAPSLAGAAAWAAENGILPPGAALTDGATFAAVAEMFLNYHGTFGGTT